MEPLAPMLLVFVGAFVIGWLSKALHCAHAIRRVQGLDGVDVQVDFDSPCQLCGKSQEDAQREVDGKSVTHGVITAVVCRTCRNLFREST